MLMLVGTGRLAQIRFDVRNPANRAVIAQVTNCSRAMATEAIAAAGPAQEAWAALTAKSVQVFCVHGTISCLRRRMIWRSS